MDDKRYYTTVVRQTSNTIKVGYLFGPFESEAAARERIPEARRLAEAVDPFTAFDAFGTCAVKGGPPFPVGVLNDR